MRMAVGGQGGEEGAQIDHHAAFPFLFLVVGTLHHHGIKAQAGDVDKIALMLCSFLFITDDTGILQEGTLLSQGLHRSGIVGGDPEHTAPVVAGAHADDPQTALAGRHLLLTEDAVDHLVHRAVAAYHQKLTPSLPESLPGKKGGIVDPFCEDLVIPYARLLQQGRDLRPVLLSFSVAGIGVDDDIPVAMITDSRNSHFKILTVCINSII